MCAKGVKFALAFDACVVLNPQNSVLGWLVAVVSYVEVSSVFPWELGRVLINMVVHEMFEDQLKVCRNPCPWCCGCAVEIKDMFNNWSHDCIVFVCLQTCTWGVVGHQW